MKSLLAAALALGAAGWCSLARADLPSPDKDGGYKVPDGGRTIVDNGCSVSPNAPEVGALAIAGSASLLFLLRRRRKRS